MGLTHSNKWKPSYHPRRLLQPISAWPANQPVPRRLASRVTAAVLSSASYRQRRKGGSQMQLSIAVKGAFALKLHPLAKQGQGDDFTATQRGLWPRMQRLDRQMPFAKVIAHHIQCGKVGLNVYHQLAPFLRKVLVMLTVGHCYLPFQSFLFHTKRLSWCVWVPTFSPPQNPR